MSVCLCAVPWYPDVLLVYLAMNEICWCWCYDIKQTNTVYETPTESHHKVALPQHRTAASAREGVLRLRMAKKGGGSGGSKRKKKKAAAAAAVSTSAWCIECIHTPYA